MKSSTSKKRLLPESESIAGDAQHSGDASAPHIVIRGESPKSSILSRVNLATEYAEFLDRYDWQWFCTLTFRESPHPEAAFKKFRHWINQLNRHIYGCRAQKRNESIYWALALEYTKAHVIHFHALLGDNNNLNDSCSRKYAHSLWFELAGINRIDPIDDNKLAVTRYVSKYLVKGGEIELSSNLAQFNATQLSGLAP